MTRQRRVHWLASAACLAGLALACNPGGGATDTGERAASATDGRQPGAGEHGAVAGRAGEAIGARPAEATHSNASSQSVSPSIPLGAQLAAPAATWSDSERFLLSTLRLGALPDPRPDPGNRFGDDPRAARLGERLFADPGFSRNGQVACATCHRPEFGFGDGLALSHGLADLTRNAPGLLDVAYRRWLFWDGRADSLWSQALVPIEAPKEMGFTRLEAVRRVADDPELTTLYEATFGPLPALPPKKNIVAASPLGDNSQRHLWQEIPVDERAPIDRAFAHLGMSLAAHQRRLRSNPGRFDRYVDAVLADRADEAATLLDPGEVAGLRLLMSGRSACLTCHLGPHFTDDRFHNIGTGELETPRADRGRAEAPERLRESAFNCRSAAAEWPPDAAPDCSHLESMGISEIPDLLEGAFRTPGLRNLSATAPYMHDGRFETLEEVLEHYRTPPPKERVYHELPPLDLDKREMEELARFLRALGAE